MALDESLRRELFESLDTALGPRPAATLMAHLPPVGWADVATKHDLGELERRTDLRFDGIDRRLDGIDHRLDGIDHRLDRIDDRLDAVDGRFGELRREMTKQTYALLFGLGTLMIALTSVVIAALHFGAG